MLKDMLVEFNLIRLEIEVSTWQEAIHQGVDVLEKNGIVNSCYGDSIIEATKKFGPYYVIGPGFALPHSRPEDGVIRKGISIITLKKPVLFGKVEHDPVDLVITLAATDNNSHIDLMTELVNVMSISDNIEKLRRAKTISEALDLFD